MVGSLIIMAAALTGQPAAPGDREAIGREAVPIVGQVATATARAKARAAGEATAPAAKADAKKLIAKRKAKKAAAYVRRIDGQVKEAIAEAKAAKDYEKLYKQMLPYMLENQRQQLERLSAAERNQVLNRMAGAMERQAGYVYPGQSPTTGPYR